MLTMTNELTQEHLYRYYQTWVLFEGRSGASCQLLHPFITVFDESSMGPSSFLGMIRDEQSHVWRPSGPVWFNFCRLDFCWQKKTAMSQKDFFDTRNLKDWTKPLNSTKKKNSDPNIVQNIRWQMTSFLSFPERCEIFPKWIFSLNLLQFILSLNLLI